MDTQGMIPIRIPFGIPLPNGTVLPRAVWCYGVSAERSALIDTGVAGNWPEIRKAFYADGMTASRLGFVLFTHAHPDHIGAARTVRARTTASFCAHADAVPWIENTALQKRERPVPGFDSLVEGGVMVDRKVEDGALIDLGDTTLRAILTPGHARGHFAYHCEERGALFTGDALPEPDAMPVYTDLVATMQSLRRLRSLLPLKALYSAWEPPIYGAEEIEARFDAARAWLQRVHETVRKTAHAEATSDLPSLTRSSLRELGLPASLVNPLTVATVRAHWLRLDRECVDAV